MTGMQSLNHEFVQFMPADLADGVLYVSIPFVTAMHLCCCGCGNEVVTPLNPDAWRLTFDGESASLHPSISSPDLDCRSHYWITHDKVCWVPQWSERKPGSRSDLGQVHDRSQSTVRRITDFGRLRSLLSILKTKLAGAFWPLS